MDKGKVLAGGTLNELLSGYNSGEIIEFIPEDINNRPDFAGVDGIRNVEWDVQAGRCRLTIDSIVQTLPAFLKYTSSVRYGLQSLECRKMTLEDLFVGMTGRKLSDDEQQS
jgi:ABC-2 type transport system ATP-binding protein